MYQEHAPAQSPILVGNRCGHYPRTPQLSPPEPIRKGLGGLPRLLSLAAERAKEWFFHPDKCPQLQTSPDRQTRSERREACQIVLEALLSRLDLTSLCVGIPTPATGFTDIDMKTIVRLTGLGQRRCERAIGQLKAAGFITVKQPRYKMRKVNISASGRSGSSPRTFLNRWAWGLCWKKSGPGPASP